MGSFLAQTSYKVLLCNLHLLPWELSEMHGLLNLIWETEIPTISTIICRLPMKRF